MVKPEILEMVPMNLSELKEELNKIKKRDVELNFRAKKTEEYVTSVPTNPKAKDIYDKIHKLNIPRLKDTYIHKFIDMMPVTVEDTKVILQGQTVSISNDNVKKIVALLDQYR